MKTQLKVLLDGLISLVNSEKLLNKSRYNEKSFTRNRKLPFKKLLFFMLNTVSKSSEVALVKYFDIIGAEYSVTQQALRNLAFTLRYLIFYHIFTNER